MDLVTCPLCLEYLVADVYDDHLASEHNSVENDEGEILPAGFFLSDEEAADVLVALTAYLKAADKKSDRVPAGRVERLKAILKRLEAA